MLLRHSSHTSAAGAGAQVGPTPTASRPASASATPSSPPQSPRQQAAESLAALLAQSVSDRNLVVHAVSDINRCGPTLSQDSQTFAGAASSRQHLLSRLESLPNRSALPAPMLQALTAAWQASARADQEYARWAQDEATQGCTRNDHSDPGYQAALRPDGQATVGKKAFARLWNPLAAQYGLTLYRWSQL